MAAPTDTSSAKGAEARATSPGGTLALPPPSGNGGISSVMAALNTRRSERSFDTAAPALPLAKVASLLWAAQGVTLPPQSLQEGSPKGRTCPSAGGLFPLEIFLAVGDNSVEARRVRGIALFRAICRIVTLAPPPDAVPRRVVVPQRNA